MARRHLTQARAYIEDTGNGETDPASPDHMRRASTSVTFCVQFGPIGVQRMRLVFLQDKNCRPAHYPARGAFVMLATHRGYHPRE